MHYSCEEEYNADMEEQEQERDDEAQHIAECEAEGEAEGQAMEEQAQRKYKIDKIYEIVGTENIRYDMGSLNNKDAIKSLMIGDVFDWLHDQETRNDGKDKKELRNKQSVLIITRMNGGFRKPLQEQTAECVDYVYNLVTNAD